MQAGFSYTEAWHMSHRDARRYAGIYAATKIPAGQLQGGKRLATKDDFSILV